MKTLKKIQAAAIRWNNLGGKNYIKTFHSGHEEGTREESKSFVKIIFRQRMFLQIYQVMNEGQFRVGFSWCIECEAGSARSNMNHRKRNRR